MKVRSDAIVAASLVALGGFMIFYSAGFRKGSVQDPIGSRGLVVGIGVFFVIGGVVLLARALRLVHDGVAVLEGEGAQDEPGVPASGVRPMVAWSACIAYVAALPIIGFPLATPLLTFGLLWMMRVRSAILLVSVPAGFTLFAILLFRVFLGIDLPTGPMDFLER